MTNFQFLQKYYALQKDNMFDRLEVKPYGWLAYCATDRHAFWNNVLVKRVLEKQELQKVEEDLAEMERKAAVCFENKVELKPLVDMLVKNEFQKVAEDSWMFYEGNGVDGLDLSRVKKVEIEADLELFLQVFDACYQKDDPQNPYGELGEYVVGARNTWLKFRDGERVEYFMVYDQERVVAVATLTNFEGVGYISNVGSLRGVRGQGCGRLATLYCVQRSMELGNELHCLATEEGTYPNEFYRKVGFETRFRALVYGK